MSLRRTANPKPAPRILLVDDNRSGLAARRSVLEELGYSTTGVACPKQAVELFAASAHTGEEFGLVITDYKMPEQSGVDLIWQIRLIEASVPIILLSGFVDALGLTESNTGADVVIMKSANEVAHLVRAVNRHLSGAVRRKGPKPAAPAPKGRRAASTA
ncbi:MAG TPA: response regulator [Bryobacteraceae bacterium]|nr:response regulator [Bryobacteraceae bacterium]HPT25496.1 response regulator [Bryobacteraceae bacterium]